MRGLLGFLFNVVAVAHCELSPWYNVTVFAVCGVLAIVCYAWHVVKSV
jgi:hypothetical protein